MGRYLKPSDGWEIQEVCKTCEYRKSFYGYTPARSDKSMWIDTYCAYLEETGQFRECEPCGDECKKYLRRGEVS